MFAIRAARPEEAKLCATIHLRARDAMDYLPRDRHSPAETRAWKRDVVFATQEVLVAEGEDASVLGYLSLDGDWISNLYVLPRSQGLGIGSALLNAAKARRPGGLRLWVFQPNTGAIRFYARHGFRTERETDGRDNKERVPDALMAWSGSGNIFSK